MFVMKLKEVRTNWKKTSERARQETIEMSYYFTRKWVIPYQSSKYISPTSELSLSIPNSLANTTVLGAPAPLISYARKPIPDGFISIFYWNRIWTTQQFWSNPSHYQTPISYQSRILFNLSRPNPERREKN